jgi:hypothetical protein
MGQTTRADRSDRQSDGQPFLVTVTFSWDLVADSRAEAQEWAEQVQVVAGGQIGGMTRDVMIEPSDL